jgi:hypothetical protein
MGRADIADLILSAIVGYPHEPAVFRCWPSHRHRAQLVDWCENYRCQEIRQGERPP